MALKIQTEKEKVASLQKELAAASKNSANLNAELKVRSQPQFLRFSFWKRHQRPLLARLLARLLHLSLLLPLSVSASLLLPALNPFSDHSSPLHSLSLRRRTS